jgi:hypothetical protein
MVLAGLAVLPMVETIMGRLEALILKVSDLHHRGYPVAGTPASDLSERAAWTASGAFSCGLPP